MSIADRAWGRTYSRAIAEALDRLEAGRPAAIGRHVLGAMLAILGVMMTANREFSPSWQLAPSHLPARSVLAVVLGAWLVVAGTGLQVRKAARAAGMMAAGALVLGMLSYLPLVPARGLTYEPWLHLGEQAMMAMAAGLVAARFTPGWARARARRLRLACIGFGLCELSLAVTHIDALEGTANLVPAWLPPGQAAWAILTAIFHLAAGVALISGERALLATRALAAMFAGFSLLVWAPRTLASPGDWQLLAVNLLSWALTAAVWVLGEALAEERRLSRQ